MDFDIHCPMIPEHRGLNFKKSWCLDRMNLLLDADILSQIKSGCFHTKVPLNEDVRECKTFLGIITEDHGLDEL